MTDFYDDGQRIMPDDLHKPESEIDWYRPRHQPDENNHRCAWDQERLPCPTMQWLATLDAERAASAARIEVLEGALRNEHYGSMTTHDPAFLHGHADGEAERRCGICASKRECSACRALTSEAHRG